MARHWFTTYLTSHYSQNKKLGLDIGCGKKPYKEIYNCPYLGIDIPSEELKGTPNFFANGEHLPFKNDTFDFITCYSVIPYVEDIEKFLNEIFRIMKNDGIAVFTIMNLRALSRDPTGYYLNKFTSKQLNKKLIQHRFKSIKFKNLKTFFWSTYFNITSVYSYAIVKCVKDLPKQTVIKKNNSPSFPTKRQSLRDKVIKHPKLYSVSKNFYRSYCNTTSSFHTLPDFLIIGAAKCGTSSLYDYLMQHPNVGKSLTKQIHFFDRYFDRSVSWYKVCFPFLWQKFYMEKIQHKKFSTGEATAHYMTHPLAAQRAHKVIPNVKIIVMLRNPADRAYSHYSMEKDHNNEKLSFEEAIEKEPERIKGEIEEMLNNQNNSGRNYPHKAYLKGGEYIEQILRWRKFFPKENFIFIKSEDFNKNPSLIYNEVLNFLKLPPYELEKYEKIRKRKYEKMKPDTRKKLVEYFYPYNKKLCDFLNKELGYDQ